MESDKSRGLKHIKDKRKYKGNTTKISKYVPPKTQPNLQSNWYRYEDSDATENQDDETKDSDFSVLADAPITKGTHFQTKSDKLLANATESTAFDGLFTLNLEKLEESLMAIPFYKRIGIDEKYFSDNQIHDMNSDSEKRLKKFIKLNESAILKSPIEQTSTDIEMKSNENIKSESNVATGSIPILENLILEDHSTVENEISEKSKNSEDLEKWLDDFLNE